MKTFQVHLVAKLVVLFILCITCYKDHYRLGFSPLELIIMVSHPQATSVLHTVVSSHRPISPTH